MVFLLKSGLLTIIPRLSLASRKPDILWTTINHSMGYLFLKIANWDSARNEGLESTSGAHFGSFGPQWLY